MTPEAGGDAPTRDLLAEEPILQFFTSAHLPVQLQEASEPFEQLARGVVSRQPRNAERSTCLRKLLEAKDASVRSVLFKQPMIVGST